MRTSFRAAAFAAPLLFAVPAIAQDAPVQGAPAPEMTQDASVQDSAAPAPAAAQSYASTDSYADDRPFSGLYVGGSFGYDVQAGDRGTSVLFDRNLDGRFGDTVTTATGANAFSTGFCDGAARGVSLTAGGGCRNDKDDIAYYGRVGFDQQFGNIVVGIVGEFGKSEIRDSVSAFSTTPANYVFTREVNWEAQARGRAGYAANTTLFYGTGGVGYVSVDNSFSSSNTANAFTNNGNNRQWGFVAGGGLEQKIGRNFSIGLEYMYHDYRDDDFRVRVARGTAPATNPFVLAPNTTGTDLRRSDNRFRWNSLRAVANFRF